MVRTRWGGLVVPFLLLLDGCADNTPKDLGTSNERKEFRQALADRDEKIRELQEELDKARQAVDAQKTASAKKFQEAQKLIAQYEVKRDQLEAEYDQRMKTFQQLEMKAGASEAALKTKEVRIAELEAEIDAKRQELHKLDNELRSKKERLSKPENSKVDEEGDVESQ